MNLAIIPARRGSKRIPGKNIKDFCGKPIIAYSILAAVESELFDEVMISTDDAGIAEVAKRHGATVPFMRSQETSGDFATTVDVLLEVVNEYKNRGKVFENICCIYPTAPFVTAAKLRAAYDIFEQPGADAVMPVVAFSYPPLRGLIITDGKLSMKWPEYELSRSQDLEPLYHDCGQYYFVRTEALLREKKLFCENTIPIIVSELDVQDIDNEDDWMLAELKYRLMANIEQNAYFA